jgi:hypothetical protein
LLQIGSKVRAKSGDNKGRTGNIVGTIPLLNSNPIKMQETLRELSKQGRALVYTVKFDNGNLDSFEENEVDVIS